MSIRKRIATLEGRQLRKVISSDSALADLLRALQTTAERLRETPLNELTPKASPMDIAALILDGRVDDEVAAKCLQFSKQTGPSAKLFRAILEAAGCDTGTLVEGD
ncbi:hypothetical protein ROA7450_03378 [Roseovarius albus]|uniref:Uncharacterized protein n=1 Tax=Roseovarius albus TaxID=1247867 RepID=A0A1X6ZWV6_9RHOB|nr:hypothetical protein [Roseovarius albus]SLN64088.1 hypothetical protein ROA7450_03378 [Roseovarius albus]